MTGMLISCMNVRYQYLAPVYLVMCISKEYNLAVMAILLNYTEPGDFMAPSARPVFCIASCYFQYQYLDKLIILVPGCLESCSITRVQTVPLILNYFIIDLEMQLYIPALPVY